jgi:hypothetical protein
MIRTSAGERERMFFHKSREKNGIRTWWHFGTESRACLRAEFYWLSPRFGVSVESSDDGWDFSLRVPPLALYVSLDGFGLWQPIARIYTAPDGKQYPIPDRREFDFTVHDWAIRFTPWGRWGEWRAADPWWIRVLSIDLKDLVLGRLTYKAEELALVPCQVPMPEGNYPAVAKVQRVTRGRTRWFKRTGQEVDLSIPKGIPFAGKGENSWDCGDDGLFGLSGNSIDDAIRRAQASVTERRQRYGHASDDAMREALS